MKFALGGCHSKNFIKKVSINGDMEISPFLYFPCLIDFTKEGLKVPYEKIYTMPYIKGRDETSKFIKNTLDFDLNRKCAQTLISEEYDYVIVELTTLIFYTYKVTYEGRQVYSVNVHSPECYEYIGLEHERVNITKDMAYKAIDEFVEFLKNNIDLSKVILLKYSLPKFGLDENNKVHIWDNNTFETKRTQDVILYTDYFNSILPEVKMFQETNLQIAKNLKDTPLHVTDESERLQGLLFREFLLGENLQKEISETTLIIQKQIQEGIIL
jgi:hypothetical protein